MCTPSRREQRKRLINYQYHLYFWRVSVGLVAVVLLCVVVGCSRHVSLCLFCSVWIWAGWSRLVSAVLAAFAWLCIYIYIYGAGFAFLCWFCAGLCWSLLVSLFCAGFVLDSLRFRCFVLVLCWSLLVSAKFVVLCWSLLVSAGSHLHVS